LRRKLNALLHDETQLNQTVYRFCDLPLIFANCVDNVFLGAARVFADQLKHQCQAPFICANFKVVVSGIGGGTLLGGVGVVAATTF